MAQRQNQIGCFHEVEADEGRFATLMASYSQEKPDGTDGKRCTTARWNFAWYIATYEYTTEVHIDAAGKMLDQHEFISWNATKGVQHAQALADWISMMQEKEKHIIDYVSFLLFILRLPAFC